MTRYDRLIRRIGQGAWILIDRATGSELERRGVPRLDRGVRVIGGCCGMGVEHIAALRPLV